jgi:hypothetical protein
MRTQLAIVAITALLSAGVYKRQVETPVQGVSNVVSQAFDKWCQQYGRLYDTPAERNYRMAIFAVNYAKLLLKQAEAVGKPYTVGPHRFMDLTMPEFRIKHTGFRARRAQRNVQYINNVGANPDTVDWRDASKNPGNLVAVNPIKDQAMCGSCWAFSAIAATEAAYAIAGNTLTSFSEQQLVDCSTAYGNHGCNGGWMDYAFEYIQGTQSTGNDGGIETEASYPYAGVDQSCQASTSNFVATIGGYTDVPKNSMQQLENYVAQTVVSVAIDAEDIMSYQSGVYTGYCGTQLDHGVAAVGYGTDGSQEYWLVRNSWGTSWGEDGYFRLDKSSAAGTSGKCGIYLAPSIPTGAAPYQ